MELEGKAAVRHWQKVLAADIMPQPHQQQANMILRSVNGESTRKNMQET